MMRSMAVKLGIVACSECFGLQNAKTLHQTLDSNRLKLLNRSILTSFNSVATSVTMGKTDFSAVLSVVEVEKRFPFDAETEDKLIAAGANVLSHKCIKDTYLGRASGDVHGRTYATCALFDAPILDNNFHNLLHSSDTSDYCLTSADHWLRRRNGKWQLKYPSPIQMR